MIARSSFIAVASGAIMVDSSRPASATAKKPLTEDDRRKILENLDEEFVVTEDDRRKILENLDEEFVGRAERERLSWLNRPRIHTGLIEEVVQDENLAKFIADEKINACSAVDAMKQQQQQRARKLAELAKAIRLSGERLEVFKQLVFSYRRDPTIENYVRIRREFPEIEIQVARFGGLEMLFSFEEELKKSGIDPELVAGTLDAHEPSIDELSLCLMERLIAKNKLPTDGPGYLERRRSAISEAMVNYLIAVMLEALDWNHEKVRVPASLIVLIRDRLCGTNPDLHTEYLSREHRQNAAITAGQIFDGRGETISVRKLAKALTVPPSTAARWLADEEFLRWIEFGRKLARGELALADREVAQRTPKSSDQG